MPDQAAAKNHYEIAIPKLASLYLTHDWNGEVQGLQAFPRADWPPVAIVYFAFRIMVGLGLLMLALVIAGLVLWRRGRLFETGWYLRLCTWCMPIGFIAVLAGWTTTEVGRQPWVVYGLMRTADGVTPSLTAQDVWLSLAAYVVSYLVIFGGGLMLLKKLVRIGPSAAASEGMHLPVSHSPLAAAAEASSTARPSVPGARDAS